MRALREIQRPDADAFKSVVSERRPAVLRGITAGWPAVAAASSDQQLADYLLTFDRGARFEAFVAPPAVEGRYFYDDPMNGFNFQRATVGLRELLSEIVRQASGGAATGVYAGSLPASSVLPGFDRENTMPLLAEKQTEPRLWIGNRGNIAPHFDESDNLACVAAGRRRFVLFPPEQVSNLYVGPIDVTPAGLPASMVDVRAPDLERFPRFKDAAAAAFVAELEAGDAIYIPALWWHHVEALAPMNLLVNYWWHDGAADAGSPFGALAHGLLTISHLPVQDRLAWRSMFDHYVFQLGDNPAAHIPPHARGVLGDSTPALRMRIRDFLLRLLGRNASGI